MCFVFRMRFISRWTRSKSPHGANQCPEGSCLKIRPIGRGDESSMVVFFGNGYVTVHKAQPHHPASCPELTRCAGLRCPWPCIMKLTFFDQRPTPSMVLAGFCLGSFCNWVLSLLRVCVGFFLGLGEAAVGRT